MSLAGAKVLKPKQAIAKALEFFNDFFSDQGIKNVLLEELEFDDVSGNWNVTIGFDIGRESIRKPGTNALSMFGQQEVTPLREARRFEITDRGGDLVRMVDV
jgi:hypothetical protein